MTLKKFTVKLPDKSEKAKEELSTKLVNLLQDCNITWVQDGTAIITTEKSMTVIKKMIKDFKLKPMATTRLDIKHRVNGQGKEATHDRLKKSQLG